MQYINVGKENSNDINLYYEDHGKGKPVILIHGWPVSGASWEKTVPVLMKAGYRVITYDRRGFGYSSRPTSGYNYDTFSEDLNKLITQLDLRDVSLVGFSMGSGEIARYFGVYGSSRIRKAVFISAITPFLLKTPDNPTGVDGKVFEEFKAGLAADRLAFLTQFFSNFYNADLLRGKLVSDEVLWYSWDMAAVASPQGTRDCVQAWLTDFRNDVKRIDVPALIIHGDADRICPIASTGIPMQKSLKDCQFVKIKDGPHAIYWTHTEEVNRELVNFLA